MKSELLEVPPIANVAAVLRLLIIENSASDVELILRQLSESAIRLTHTVVENKDQFHAALSGNDFDAILADFRLPRWNGIEAFHELRKLERDIPFILVTGTLGEEAAVDCIKQGVHDYVLKDNLPRLPVALARALSDKSARDESTRTLEALRHSEARNRDLVDNSVYGIFRVSPEGKFLDANASLLRMLGCATPDQLGSINLCRDLFRFPERLAEILAECRERGKVHGAEVEWRRRDGGIVAVRLDVRSVSIPGNPGGLEVIAEDVTELRAMERQLRQAQKFEAIGQLAGGVAHDFNNVVGAILGWAELGIEQNRGLPQVVERFNRIREQADRAATLTRELLAFARRQILQPRATDLNAVVSGLFSFLDKVIGKNIEFRFVNEPLDAVRADHTQIEQVVMNLCLNARDAMRDSGRLVLETEMVELDDSYCRFYPHIVPGRYVVLSVSDTGAGMDAETRERIFEPFFTTKESGQGTGMGLATVYGIVRQHDGFVHVYSEPSHGSLFRVYLPTIPTALAETAAPNAALSLAQMRGTETILIAEDHESVREMARQSLTGLGYRVLAAGDGAEALALCDQEAPALAVLDVIMPKLSGPATAKQLTARFEKLPILFTSGYSQDYSVVAAASTQGRYLQKPYSPTALARMVRELLDHAPHQQATLLQKI